MPEYIYGQEVDCNTCVHKDQLKIWWGNNICGFCTTIYGERDCNYKEVCPTCELKKSK